MLQPTQSRRFATIASRAFLSPLFFFALIFSWFFAGWPQNFDRVLEIKQARAADIVYIYDDLGRLKAVVDPATDTGVYEYDAVGNLLSISRHASSEVSVIEFRPKSGPVGTTVTIFGTGFSTTTTDNAVDFNGTPATVTSATETEIVTTVPEGATTGPITVATLVGSGTSNAVFTVTADTDPPTITDFTPTIGAPGTAVTITGTNFETTLANNKVRFNTSQTTVTSATTTSLETTVPPGTGSGRISVSTSSGSTTSTADFFIPPSPYIAADVEVTGRMAIGETKTITIGAANKIALIVFDGVGGNGATLNMSGVTINSATATVYRPNGRKLALTGFGTGGGSLNFPFPVTGTYAIMIDPASTSTGSGQGQWETRRPMKARLLTPTMQGIG